MTGVDRSTAKRTEMGGVIRRGAARHRMVLRRARGPWHQCLPEPPSTLRGGYLMVGNNLVIVAISLV